MRFLPTLFLPILLLSCTKSELDQMFPPDTSKGGPSLSAGPITVKAENPGGGSRCDVLSVDVAADQAQVTQSPDLLNGGQWSRVLSAADLNGKTSVRLRATCTTATTDAQGNTITQTGFSVSEHAVTSAAQTITVTGPRDKPNLSARVEWATPVPGVLPLD